MDCWPCGLPLHVVYIPSDNSLAKTILFLLGTIDTGDNFWVRFGTCIHTPSQERDPIYLNQYRTWTCLDSHWVDVMLVLLRLEDTILLLLSVPLALTIFLYSLLHSSLHPEGRAFDEDILFETWPSVTKPYFMHIVLLWICVSSHLLQEEAVLTFESVEIVVWLYL